MPAEVVLDAKAIIFPLAVVIYIFGLSFLERRYGTPKGPVTDSDFIWKMARDRECSEYQIFHIAGEEWRTHKDTIEEDFKNYVLRDQMPFYVRDYIRRARLEAREAEEAVSAGKTREDHNPLC